MKYLSNEFALVTDVLRYTIAQKHVNIQIPSSFIKFRSLSLVVKPGKLSMVDVFFQFVN